MKKIEKLMTGALAAALILGCAVFALAADIDPDDQEEVVDVVYADEDLIYGDGEVMMVNAGEVIADAADTEITGLNDAVDNETDNNSAAGDIQPYDTNQHPDTGKAGTLLPVLAALAAIGAGTAVLGKK